MGSRCDHVIIIVCKQRRHRYIDNNDDWKLEVFFQNCLHHVLFADNTELTGILSLPILTEMRIKWQRQSRDYRDHCGYCFGNETTSGLLKLFFGE